jgi:hypothetical protein
MSQWTYKNGPRQSDVVSDATLCRMLERGELSASSLIRELPKGPWVHVRDTHFAAVLSETKPYYFTPPTLLPAPVQPITIVYSQARTTSQQISRSSFIIGFFIAALLYFFGHVNGIACLFIGLFISGSIYGERLKIAAREKIVDRL